MERNKVISYLQFLYMTKKLINFRFERSEIERLNNLKQYYGYPTLSAMVRDKLLKEDLTTKKLLEEIYAQIVNKRNKE